MDWKANWIWTSDDPHRPNSYVYARRVFELEGPPSAAWLACTADSRYELYVNGQFVGRGPIRYHYQTPYYDRYDVASLLRPGANVIAFLVRHFGTKTYFFMPVQGALICQAEIQPAGSAPLLLVSDETWRVQRAEAYPPHNGKLGVWQGYAEICDRRRVPRGWNGAEFDDSSWEAATVLGPAELDPWAELVERDIPYPFYYRLPAGSVREVGIAAPPLDVDPLNPPSAAMLITRSEQLGQGTSQVEHRAAAIYPTEECTIIHPPGYGEAVYMVVDFDREVSGFPRIEVEGEAGAIVDIGYSERMVDGRVACFHPFYDNEEQYFHYADRLILGGGPEVYQPMELRAFRFMHLEFRNHTQPVKLKSVAVMFSTYPVEYRGSFECSDHLLEQIWDMGCRTTELCMYDAFMDCPWRERSQWWGDARIEALIAYYAFGDGLLVRKGLRQIAQSETPEGALQALYPSQADCIVPAYVGAWVSSLWEYYLFHGDRQCVAELYPTLQRAMEWLESFRREDGLLRDFPFPPVWNFIDAGELLDQKEPVASLNCFYYEALRDARRIARIVEDAAGETTYRSRADRTADAINRHLWVEELGGYVEGSPEGSVEEPRLGQQANALAVALGIAPSQRANGILDRILQPDPSIIHVGTPYFGFFLLRALYHLGRHQEALECIRRRWGSMLDAGATTTWETWRPTQSLCHAWSAGPTHDLMAEVLGVKPTAPGFSRFQVRPHQADLAWAKGVVPCPQGEIPVSWVGRSGADTFMLRIGVPEKTMARVHIPECRPNHWQSIDFDGAPALRGEKVLAPVPDLESAWVEEGAHVFEIGPGDHLFEARA